MRAPSRRSLGVVFLIASMWSVVLTPGTAAAQEIGGWNQVFGPFTVQAGRETTFHLARAEFVWTHNLTVSWGDGHTGTPGTTNCVVGNSGCVLFAAHTYTNPGLYRIDLTYSTCCFTYTAATTVIVDPFVGDFIHAPLPLPQFNVVSVGDSVASGEGNPESTGWTDVPCHRSRLAGPWLAVNDILDNQNPGTAFTFDHRACTGANTGQVMSQIAGINQPVDALLMSVGANDGYWYFGSDQEYVDNASAFSTVVMNCLGAYDCSTDATLATALNNKYDNMPRRYGHIANSINALPNRVTDVYITEYFDPTRDNAGRYAPINNTFNLISPAEWEYLYDNVVVRVNDTLTAAAASHGWHVVGGIEQGFINHGYGGALPQRWVWLAEESIFLQGDHAGTAHPNVFGHKFYADRIARTLNQRTAPRLFSLVSTRIGNLEVMEEDSVVTDWTNQDVTVRTHARNLAAAGAVRMDWSWSTEVADWGGTRFQLRQSGTDHEIVDYSGYYNGACNVAGMPPCPSELRSQVTVVEEGRHLVTFTADNAWGRRSRERRVQVRIDRTPPIVGHQIFTGWSRAPVVVPYTVRDELSGVVGPQTGVVTVGEEPVLLTVSDNAGNSRTYEIPARVDLTPPVTTCSVSPSVIWPSSGKLVPLSASVVVTDAVSGPNGFVLTNVTTVEKGAIADLQGFVPGSQSTSGWLFVRRPDTRSDRVFTFTFTGADVAGHTSTCVATVTVRHDGGQMWGEGRIDAGKTQHYAFEFVVRERAPQGELGQMRLELRQRGHHVKFISADVTSVAFTDEPPSSAKRGQKSPAGDSVTFGGTGHFNGGRGYTFTARAVDRGESGRHDSVAIEIRDASGRIVMETSGVLDSGNVRSQRLPPP